MGLKNQVTSVLCSTLDSSYWRHYYERILRSIYSIVNVCIFYRSLSVEHPKKEHGLNLYKMLLPIGSTGTLVLSGGPAPREGKVDNHFKHSKFLRRRPIWTRYNWPQTFVLCSSKMDQLMIRLFLLYSKVMRITFLICKVKTI